MVGEGACSSPTGFVGIFFDKNVKKALDGDGSLT
jgi:hypothetical protein